MNEFFDAMGYLPPPFNMIVWIVLIVFGTTMLSAIATEIRKYASHRHELQFKRELVEQGLAIDEIERVINAKGRGKDSRVQVDQE